jgi:hypothetical protein
LIHQPKIKKMKKLLIAIIVLGSFASCSNYYKAVLAPQPANADSITNLKMKEKYFILRNGSEAFAMKNISISADRKNLQCSLETLPHEHMVHLNKGEKSKMEYNKPGNTGDESAVLNEVHLYISPDSNIVAGPYILALDKVKKTEIIETDKIKTKRSHTIGTAVGVSSVVIVVVGIIAGIAYTIAAMHF